MSCLDAMDGETLQQKTTHKGRENSKLQGLQGQVGSGECIWNIVSRFRVLLGTMEERPQVVRGILLTCGITKDAEDTPGRSRQGTHPSEW